MRAALEGEQAGPLRTARAVAVRASVRSPLLAFVALVLGGASVLGGGGSGDGGLAWIGGGAVLVAAAGCTAVLLGRLPVPSISRPGLLAVALLALFVIWNGASVVWSIQPDRTWDYANRGLAYLSLLVVGLLLGGAVRRTPLAALYGLAGVVAIAIAWALAGKIAPSLFPDGARIARLREPVGFWNALALLCAMGVPLSLAIASARRHADALRAGGVVLLYALAVALVLTLSRGGAAVAVLAALAWLLVGSPRLESIVALLLAGAFALGVSAWALEQPGLTQDFQPYEVRAAHGWQFGLLFGLAGAALFGVAYAASRAERARPLSERSRELLLRRLAVALGALCLAALAVGVARSGSPAGWIESQIDEFTTPAEVSQDPNRFRSVSSYRWVWLQEAWQAFEDDPLTGSGAGSFELTHRRLRDNDLNVTEPHSVPLQFLSETGIVGFLLAGGALAAGLVASVRRYRGLEGAERAAAAALLVVLGAYVVHSLVEWTWDFVALNALFFLAAGVLLAPSGGAPGPLSAPGRKYGHGRPSEKRTALGRRERPYLDWYGRDRGRREATLCSRPSGAYFRPGALRRLWALGTAVLALGLLYSIVAPRIAERRVDAAYAALERGALEEAVEIADQGRALNPLALEPLLVRASAFDLIGNEVEATHTLYAAIRLQPDNPDAWYELGAFELRVTRKLNNAFNHLDNAYALDPYGPAGGPLDEVRAIFREEKEKCFAAGTC